MQVIDFVKDKEYEKENDIKLAVIDQEGLIFTADISNDGKVFDFPFPNKINSNNVLSTHTDYYYLLFSKYFKDNPTLNDKYNYEYLFRLFIAALEQGLILFNNSTIYREPIFTINDKKKSGQLLIPTGLLNSNQLASISHLKELIKDFYDIEVNIYSGKTKNDNYSFDSRTGYGVSAIDDYLLEQGFDIHGKKK